MKRTQPQELNPRQDLSIMKPFADRPNNNNNNNNNMSSSYNNNNSHDNDDTLDDFHVSTLFTFNCSSTFYYFMSSLSLALSLAPSVSLS